MIKIIIVDDHPKLREAWRFMLDLHKDMSVIAVCCNAQELFDSCLESLPDLALIDINMEPLNGFETAALLRSKFPSIQIIGISINAEPSYAHKMLEIGAKGFITKTSSFDEIVKGILQTYKGDNYISEEIRSKMSSSDN